VIALLSVQFSVQPDWRKKAGFTLIELLAVIAVIAILRRAVASGYQRLQIEGETLMVFEIPAISPYSWHDPPRPFSAANAVFNDARNMVSFVDGHANYIRIYWNTNRLSSGGVSYITFAADYDPPAGYDYKWSAD